MLCTIETNTGVFKKKYVVASRRHIVTKLSKGVWDGLGAMQYSFVLLLTYRLFERIQYPSVKARCRYHIH